MLRLSLADLITRLEQPSAPSELRYGSGSGSAGGTLRSFAVHGHQTGAVIEQFFERDCHVCYRQSIEYHVHARRVALLMSIDELIQQRALALIEVRSPLCVDSIF
jgi:hypothetical protein